MERHNRGVTVLVNFDNLVTAIRQNNQPRYVGWNFSILGEFDGSHRSSPVGAHIYFDVLAPHLTNLLPHGCDANASHNGMGLIKTCQQLAVHCSGCSTW